MIVEGNMAKGEQLNRMVEWSPPKWCPEDRAAAAPFTTVLSDGRGKLGKRRRKRRTIGIGRYEVENIERRLWSKGREGVEGGEKERER